jgi:hypothetical protein
LEHDGYEEHEEIRSSPPLVFSVLSVLSVVKDLQ